MKPHLWVLLLFAGWSACSREDAPKGGVESITAGEMKADVLILASDDMKGRKAGTPSGRKAAAWLADRFKANGLLPWHSEQGYEQPFESRGVKSRNVIGIMEGADPSAYVIVGAHYDHLGVDGEGRVYPGADDNASSVSVMLEVMEAFSEGGIRPPQTVVFIGFGGEEVGLLGSRHFVSHPIRPLDRCRLMLNLEVMGRNEGACITSMVHSELPDWAVKSLEAAAASVGWEVKDGGRAYLSQGDHWPFYGAKVPAACLYGGANHPDIHQPTDTADKVDAAWMEKAGKMIFRFLSGWKASAENG